MFISDLELLRHIQEEVDFVLTATNGKNEEGVINDPILCRAVVRSLEIIGEATKKIHPDFKSMHLYVEWKKIAGTRDKLIHEYFGVDYDIVWDIIVSKLPDLKYYVDGILNEKNK